MDQEGLTPAMCKAVGALLGGTVADLASAASVGSATVKRFEAGSAPRSSSIKSLMEALQGAGLEFIPVGG